MKKILFILSVLSLISCKKEAKGWTEEDRKDFMQSCVAADPSSQTEERCECGLKVLENKYSSYQEAQDETAKMTEDQLAELLSNCNF